MDKEELKNILELHSKWLNNEPDGKRVDLRRANLRGATGNMEQIKSIFLETYPIVYTSEIMQIGCERHSIEEWLEFTDGEISRMDNKALDFWVKYEDYIRTTIELSPAEPTNYKGD